MNIEFHNFKINNEPFVIFSIFIIL
jgi:hypothetical protein